MNMGASRRVLMLLVSCHASHDAPYSMLKEELNGKQLIRGFRSSNAAVVTVYYSVLNSLKDTNQMYVLEIRRRQLETIELELVLINQFYFVNHALFLYHKRRDFFFNILFRKCLVYCIKTGKNVKFFSLLLSI